MVFSRSRGQSWLVLLGLLVGLVGAPGVGRAQGADPARTVKFRDVTLQTPGPDWHLVDQPASSDLSPALRIQRQLALHDERIVVADTWAPATLVPTEVASQFFSRDKATTSDNGKFEGFQEGTRTIPVTPYPTLSILFTPAPLTPVTIH